MGAAHQDFPGPRITLVSFLLGATAQRRDRIASFALPRAKACRAKGRRCDSTGRRSESSLRSTSPREGASRGRPEVEIIEEERHQAVRVRPERTLRIRSPRDTRVRPGHQPGTPGQGDGTFGRATGMCWHRAEIPGRTQGLGRGARFSMSSASTLFQFWPAFAKKHQPTLADRDGEPPVGPQRLFLTAADIMADIFVPRLQSSSREGQAEAQSAPALRLDFDPVVTPHRPRPLLEREPTWSSVSPGPRRRASSTMVDNGRGDRYHDEAVRERLGPRSRRSVRAGS